MGWGFGPVSMLIFWGLLLVVAVLIVRWLAGLARGARSEPGESGRARAILARRYARGEIGREEFGRMKRDLEG